MSQIKTLNGVQYTLPQYNDTAWGANTGNVLTQYLAAIADVTLQLSGGAFTLTAEADFGGNFGLKALYLKSETANPASAGVMRLAKTDSIKWRNNANGADVALGIDVSDNLQYASTKVLLSGAVVNADINSSAAIAYSKLALTGAILNADLAGSIAYSKLTALTTSRALQSNSSTGFVEVSSVTNTELGYVSGVTSAIQTQLNATVSNPLSGNLAAGSHKITGLTDGSALTDSATVGQLPYRAAPVQATISGVVSGTSSTFYDVTGLTVTTGTPKSSSSRFKITVSGCLAIVGGGKEAFATIVRGSTNIGGTNGFVGVVASAGNTQSGICMCYIDAPASATAVTYKVQIKNSDNAATTVWGDSNVVSTIIVEEIL